jgi:sigma-B regulation protein RsbQ
MSTVTVVSVRDRNDVRVSGAPGARPMVFAHGYGCDQHMWRYVTPHFTADHQVVTFDHVGFGNSDLTAYDPARYGSLRGYAADVVEVLTELDLTDAVFVGHSVSAMIGVLAHAMAPERIGAMVMVGPSARYVDDDDYVGGFSRAQLRELLDSLDANHLAWSNLMGPQVMGNLDRPELAAELTTAFCRTDPDVARQFARISFLSDNRADLAGVDVPALVLQCSEDVIAPVTAGRFVHEHIAGSTFVQLAATGHCPHLSAPEETSAAIRAWL